MQAIVFFIFEDTLMKMESEECGRARIVHHVPKKKELNKNAASTKASATNLTGIGRIYVHQKRFDWLLFY